AASTTSPSCLLAQSSRSSSSPHPSARWTSCTISAPTSTCFRFRLPSSSSSPTATSPASRSSSLAQPSTPPPSLPTAATCLPPKTPCVRLAASTTSSPKNQAKD